MGEPKEVPYSWLQTRQAPTTAAIWGANQQVEDLSVCVSLSFPVTLSNKYTLLSLQRMEFKSKYLSAIKKDEIPPFATNWSQLETIQDIVYYTIISRSLKSKLAKLVET